LTIYGHIQPDRLGEFAGLASDRLLQRFAPIRAAKASTGRVIGAITGEPEYHAAIARLADFRGRNYRTVTEGSQIIRQMERDGTEYATLTDYGGGFQRFCGKLHGTLARTALLLQMLDDPDTSIVQPDAIIRADHLVRDFLLPHACDFYAARAADRVARTRDIAGWLLTTAPARIRASDFGKGLSLQQLNEALDPLVTGGWLEPNIPFKGNREWKLDLAVRAVFAKHAAAAATRREEIRRLWKGMTRRNGR
jgi:hypothetical protein